MIACDPIRSEPGRACARVLDAVEDLAPQWRSRARRAEEAGMLPRETVDELFEAGLMQMMIPRQLGGLELGWPAMVEVSRRAARACASTGWTIALVGGHAAIAARLPPAMRAQVFETGPRQLVATATPSETGLLTGEESELRLNGLWRYSTGIDYATWILARCFRPEDRVRQARPSTFVLLDPSQVEVRDETWAVMGMRATGSKDFIVAEQHVPPEMTASLSEVLDTPREDGVDYAYRVPFRPYFYSWLVGSILGCAEGAHDSYLVNTRADGMGGTGTTARAAIQERVAESAAKLACAGHLYRSIVDILHAAGLSRRTVTPQEQAQLGRDRAYLARLCLEAVHLLIRQLGTRAMIEANPFCRYWRDLQVMASHLDVSWDNGMQAYGEFALQQ